MNGTARNGGGWRASIVGLALVGLFLSFGHVATAEESSSALTEPDPDDVVASQTARDVFSGHQYWWKRKADVKSSSAVGSLLTFLYENFIRPVLKAIWDLVEWILRSLFGGWNSSGGDWSAGIPFLWTIVALLAALILWRLIASFRNQSTVSRQKPPEVAIDILPQANLLLDQARMALSQGDRRSAIRLAFLSLLAWFQDRGQLKYDVSRSNREYLRDLHKWPESAASFRAAADPFERCWYGGRDLDAVQVQDVIALCLKHLQSAKGQE